MLKLVGALLLIGGMGYLGLSAGRELTRRTVLLAQLIGALERLRGELVFRLTPLPVLCGKLSDGLSAPLEDFFLTCARWTEEQEGGFTQGWKRAVGELRPHLEEEAARYLEEMGLGLGRCDGEEEDRRLEAGLERLRGCLARMEEDTRRRRRLYGMLGVTAGAFFTVLLI